ncbi:MAG: sodium:proton antiporter [Opitutaceae bacterium]|nr:sodium:proton antiporter [Opitutaceae bacterium]
MKASLTLATVDSALGDIPLWLTMPFALLLILIAAMPLSPARIKHFWENYYAHTAIALGVAVASYYLFFISGGGVTVLHTAQEYFSFICLIGSLFVVAGGIHINVKGGAAPLDNVVFLAVGAAVANLIGTTGASMVLIRPFIRMNKIRISAYHIVFFIFIVSNCGGALTPIGDPPLFLGYLRGVPFFWLINEVLVQWLVTIGMILAVFFVIDRRAYRHVAKTARAKIEAPDTWRFEGGLNVLLLLAIIGAVFLPERFFLREAVMLGAAAASWRLTPPVVHAENHFSFGPIKEVAFLFFGIFLTMMPALGYIDRHGDEFGVRKPLQYYVSAGSLSAVLDNAPTYATFLRLAETTAMKERPEDFPANPKGEAEMVAGLRSSRAGSNLIIAVSLGAVFFGAMTYIGNGPNFMVKSIAEGAGIKVPTFFGYIFKYSLPFLLPILLLSGWLFL